MSVNEKIFDLLDEKINEIFYQMQMEMGIEEGGIDPFDAVELDKMEKAMANKIEVILNSQKPME